MAKLEVKWIAVAAVAVAPLLIAASSESAVADNSTRVMINGLGDAPQKTRLLTMTAGVISFDTDPESAWRDNADAIARLRGRLSRYGIKDEDIRTTSLNLSPRTKYENHQETVGFEVTHNLTIVFRDINRTGVVLDALVDAGAKSISGPRFSWEAGEPALAVARAKAIADANQRAQFYAKALGLRVRRVVSMRDGGGYASGQPGLPAMAYSRGTEIAPGEDTVRLSVYGEYELVR
jgi:hypothetical protein